MKKLLLTVLTLPLLLTGQKNDVPTGVRLSPPADVPAIVTEKFRLEFPKASASWMNQGDEAYLAAFRDDSTQLPRRVLYSATGKKIESHSRVESGSYPPAIDEYYLRNDPTAKFLLWKLDKEGQPPVFYAAEQKDTLWFSQEGKPRGKRQSNTQPAGK